MPGQRARAALATCGARTTARTASSASTAGAKGPASRRRSSLRPEALVFEARTRTRRLPGVRRRRDVAPDQGGDHRRFPHHPLQLHDHQRAQAGLSEG